MRPASSSNVSKMANEDGPSWIANHETVPAGDQRRFYAGVRDALRGICPNPVPPIQALAVMAVVEAGILSSREGRRMALSLTQAERAAYDRSRP